MTRAFVAAVAVGLAPQAAAAADHWVDADASTCPAAGTEEDPYPTIDCALTNAALAAGDRILLADAEGTYDGASTDGLGLPSGTAAAPIVIEPAPGASAVLSSGMTLSGVDDWTIRGLTFQDGGGNAITVNGGARLTIEDVQILDWGGPGIVSGSAGTTDLTILRNRIARPLQRAMFLEDVDGGLVTGNEIVDVVCAPSSFDLCLDCGPEACFGCGDCLGVTGAECLQTESFEYGGRTGIRVLGDSRSVEVSRNFIHDFASEECGASGTRSVAIWVTGADARDGSISHNYITSIAPGAAGHGVMMFQSSPGWVVDHNVIVDAGTCGLCEGDVLFFGGVGTTWSHNTIVDAPFGIDVRAATDATFARNLVAAATTAAVRVQADGIAAAPTMTANVYDGAAIGQWDAAVSDLPGWQAACGCDEDARAGDPGFGPGEDYTPGLAGPAADLPAGGAAPFHGEGPDAGALEAPALLGARIEAERPNIVVVDVDNRVAPPLSGVEACAGLTVEAGGVALRPIVCTAVADDRLEIELAAPADGAAEIRLGYAAGGIADASRIGGRVGARLAPADLAVDNAAPPIGPEDGTVGGDGSGEGDGTGGSSGAAGGDEGGCACDVTPRPADAAWLWLLVIALRRRDRSR